MIGRFPDDQALHYVVFVDDNFHYQNPDGRYKAGRFAKLDDAIATCERIVLQSLADCHRPGMTADELYEHYIAFGDDPFVIDVAPNQEADVPFSAWQFARGMAASVVLAVTRPQCRSSR